MDASRYDEYLRLLDFHDVTPLEAERIAEKCFHAQAWLVKDIAAAELKELLVGDADEVVKAELMITVPSEYTNADTRKAWVTTRQSRKEATEKYIKAKAQLEYLKRLLKLFDSAQFYFAGKARR
jgi:galactose-1-phosphate uridylyltransferase